MENDILKRILMVNGLLYKPVVTPSILRDCLIMLAHDNKDTTDSREHMDHSRQFTTGKV